MRTIQGLLEKYSAVKIRKAETLFDIEPNWDLVKSGACGVCGRKLRIPKSGRIAYCGRKRCPARPKFIITMKKLYELKTR